MGRFTNLHPARLSADARQVIHDDRVFCQVKRRKPDLTTEETVVAFWGRIANIGRQTTGLEAALVTGEVTGTLWVLRIPVNIPILRHDDEIWTEGERYRIIALRSLQHGQIAILSAIQ